MVNTVNSKFRKENLGSAEQHELVRPGDSNRHSLVTLNPVLDSKAAFSRGSAGEDGCNCLENDSRATARCFETNRGISGFKRKVARIGPSFFICTRGTLFMGLLQRRYHHRGKRSFCRAPLAAVPGHFDGHFEDQRLALFSSEDLG